MCYDGSNCLSAGSGTCIGFNPFLDHLFLVGSESGHVYKCSKAYTKHFLNVTKVGRLRPLCILLLDVLLYCCTYDLLHNGYH